MGTRLVVHGVRGQAVFLLARSAFTRFETHKLSNRRLLSVEDVRALARHVLVHRVLTNFRAESEGITSASIVDRLLAQVRG